MFPNTGHVKGACDVLYMHDLMLRSETVEELQKQLQTFSGDIHAEFGLGQMCAAVNCIFQLAVTNFAILSVWQESLSRECRLL